MSYFRVNGITHISLHGDLIFKLTHWLIHLYELSMVLRPKVYAYHHWRIEQFSEGERVRFLKLPVFRAKREKNWGINP